MAAAPQYLKPTPAWEEHEKPTMPGSASMPWHPPHIRFAYALVALLVGITGGLGNALVSANLPAIQGTLGLTPAEAAWLPAAYIMVNVTSNLMVFKFRQQFGLRLFAEIGLSLYAFVTLLHLLVGGFEMAILVRAVSGLAGATTSTLAMLYMLQAAPKKYTGKMLVLGVGIAQIATPLAWLMSPALLDMGQWHNLYLFEAGLALCSLAAVVVLKLPPGIHIKVIEPLDFVTFSLMAPAVAMIVAVLAQGFTRWWFDTPWLAYLLIGAVILMTIALFIEHHRANPLIQTRWLMMGPTIRFMIGAFLIRFLTSEQTYGAVGLLRTLGMGPDQMQPLFAVILAGTICGMVASSLTFSPKTVIPQILFSILLFGVAAWLDYGRTSLDRPHDFFVSQFLVALGAGMFMGTDDHDRHHAGAQIRGRSRGHLCRHAGDDAKPGRLYRRRRAQYLPAAPRACALDPGQCPAQSRRPGRGPAPAPAAADLPGREHRPGPARRPGRGATGPDQPARGECPRVQRCFRPERRDRHPVPRLVAVDRRAPRAPAKARSRSLTQPGARGRPCQLNHDQSTSSFAQRSSRRRGQPAAAGRLQQQRRSHPAGRRAGSTRTSSQVHQAQAVDRGADGRRRPGRASC